MSNAACLGINFGHHVGGEVDDLLQVLWSDIKQVPKARGNSLEVPNMGDWGGQLNVAHALTAHL